MICACGDDIHAKAWWYTKSATLIKKPHQNDTTFLGAGDRTWFSRELRARSSTRGRPPEVRSVPFPLQVTTSILSKKQNHKGSVSLLVCKYLFWYNLRTPLKKCVHLHINAYSSHALYYKALITPNNYFSSYIIAFTIEFF